MPTYQYACKDCGHAFEQVQAFSDDALTECPVCQGQLRKVFNAVGVVFKGSGFYRTDSRSASEKSAAAKDSRPAAAKSEKSGSEKSGSEKSGSTSTKEPAAASATDVVECIVAIEESASTNRPSVGPTGGRGGRRARLETTPVDRPSSRPSRS